jgi:transposase-like protein
MPRCKNCNKEQVIKSGKVNDKQRYHCHDCGYYFTEGDRRTNEKIVAKKPYALFSTH